MIARRMLTPLLLVILVAPPQAQTPAPGGGAVVRATGTAPAGVKAEVVDLLVGRSTVLNLDAPIARVSLTTPDVADAMVTAPQQLLVHGKTAGTISLFVWERSGAIKTFEVVVRRDLGALNERLLQLFPGEPISAASTGKDVVLAGTVSSKYVIEKAADVAAGYVEKKENVVNLLRQQEGVASNQILLRVRFAEVSRSALQELGASWFTSPLGVKNTIGRVTTQQFAAPGFNDLEWTKASDDFGAPVTSAKGKFTFSDFLNIFLFNQRYDLGMMVRALETRGLFQSLAEPNLVALNGKEASFLAGGEFPYPVVQGAGGANLAVTIQFKEFGVRLNFTPTVLGGDLIHLRVRPEVSSLDFNNAVTIQGFRIPSLSTRRTETEVELRDGQTFAIAGLLNNSAISSMSKVPGLGDIPILGLLFRSRAYQKAETELAVFITPQIVRAGSTGASSGVPTLVEPFLGPPARRLPSPAPFTGSPKYPTSGQAGTAGSSESPAPANPNGDAFIWGPSQQPSAPPSVQPAQPNVPAAPPTVSSAQPNAPAGQPTASASSTPPTAPAARPAAQPAQAPQTSAPLAPVRDPKAEPIQQPVASGFSRTKAEAKAEHERHQAEAKQREEDAKRAAIEARARAEQQQRDEEAARKRAEAEKKKAEQKAEEDKRVQAVRAREEARRRVEDEKRAAEAAKKQAEEDRRRAKALAEAQARLKAAQSDVERIKKQ